jgi:hypothetical protein
VRPRPPEFRATPEFPDPVFTGEGTRQAAGASAEGPAPLARDIRQSRFVDLVGGRVESLARRQPGVLSLTAPHLAFSIGRPGGDALARSVLPTWDHCQPQSNTGAAAAAPARSSEDDQVARWFPGRGRESPGVWESSAWIPGQDSNSAGKDVQANAD